MKCRNCGTELKETSRFCPNCGTAVDMEDTLAKPNENQVNQSELATQGAEPDKISKTSQFNQPVYMEESQQTDDADTAQSDTENASHSETNESENRVAPDNGNRRGYDNGNYGSYTNLTDADGYPLNWVGSLPLIDNYMMCFREKYFDFSGRATRGEYSKFTLVQFIVCFFVSSLLWLFTDFGYFVHSAINLILLIPALSVQVRRLHDIGRNALWYLLVFIPFGGLVIFIFNLQKSQPNPNEYGPLPDYSHYAP